jgi:hypothetical protein
MTHEFASAVLEMRLVQTEKLLDWMAGNAPEDPETINAIRDAVQVALAEVRRLQPA